MKFLGYVLIAIGSLTLSRNGFGIDTWQWWVIFLSLISGEFLICEDNDL